MKPISISEKLLFSTVMLEAQNGSRGTGFFFNFRFNDYTVPVIITNKHVINEDRNAIMKFNLHLKNEDDSSDESIQVNYKGEWIFHSTHDLCCCFVNPLFEQIKKSTKREVFFIPIEESLIYNKEKLKDLSAIEDVIMIGYPIGLTDLKNNLPLFRKGITASHPSISFNNEGVGAIDMACFPGSSGSPILILDEGSYTDKKGNMFLGTSRIIFMGILFSGPIRNERGNIEITEIPTSQQITSVTPIMINLGYYIHAYEVFEFRNIIEEIFKMRENR